MPQLSNPNYLTFIGFESNPESTSTDNIAASTKYVDNIYKVTGTAGATKQINLAAAINWELINTAQVTTLDVRKDDGTGKPDMTSGGLLGTTTYTPTGQFQMNSGSITAANVTVGDVIHVVIHGSGYSGTNQLNIRRIEDTSGLLVAAGMAGSRTSSDSGSTWSAQNGNYMGCGGIGYVDGSFDGVGWSDFDLTTLNSSTEMWGEKVNFSQTITIDQVEFWVKKNGAGTPTGDCNYYIYNRDTSTYVVSPTQFVAAATVTTSYAKYVKALASSITLTAGVNYVIGLQGVDTGTLYQIMRVKTTNTNNSNAMTFGGTTACLAQAPAGSLDTTRDLPLRLRLVNGVTFSPAMLLNFID